VTHEEELLYWLATIAADHPLRAEIELLLLEFHVYGSTDQFLYNKSVLFTELKATGEII
jgi:hypothetical protein